MIIKSAEQSAREFDKACRLRMTDAQLAYLEIIIEDHVKAARVGNILWEESQAAKSERDERTEQRDHARQERNEAQECLMHSQDNVQRLVIQVKQLNARIELLTGKKHLDVTFV